MKRRTKRIVLGIAAFFAMTAAALAPVAYRAGAADGDTRRPVSDFRTTAIPESSRSRYGGGCETRPSARQRADCLRGARSALTRANDRQEKTRRSARRERHGLEAAVAAAIAGDAGLAGENASAGAGADPLSLALAPSSGGASGAGAPPGGPFGFPGGGFANGGVARGGAPLAHIPPAGQPLPAIGGDPPAEPPLITPLPSGFFLMFSALLGFFIAVRQKS